MLVFTRKLDEAIVIGDGIEIRVLRIGRDGVRIGVTAASHVPVHRLEIYDQIRSANTSAAAAPDAAHDLVTRLKQHGDARQVPAETPHVARRSVDAARSR